MLFDTFRVIGVFRGSIDSKPKIVRCLSSGQGAINHVISSSDKRSLLSATHLGKAELWDLAKGKVKTSLNISISPLLKIVELEALSCRLY